MLLQQCCCSNVVAVMLSCVVVVVLCCAATRGKSKDPAAPPLSVEHTGTLEHWNTAFSVLFLTFFCAFLSFKW